MRALLVLATFATGLPAQDIRLCRGGGEAAERERAAMLWRRVSVALESSETVRAGRATESLAIQRFERTLGRDGEVRAETAMNPLVYGTSPFRSAPPDVLVREGYVVTDSLGSVEFRAPDASVFLSDEFARGHCLQTVVGTGAMAGLVGLSFQPLRAGRRDPPGIEGAFWAEAESATLRFVEFSYRAALPPDAADVGGKLVFEQLPSGNWIAREWRLRVPVMTQRMQLLGYREEGGVTMVLSAAMLAAVDSIEATRKAPGRITGVVVDSLARRVFTGATVWVDSASPRTTSDNAGSFWLHGVTPGLRILSFTHPTLDSIGVKPVGFPILVGSDSTSHIVLAGPTLAALKGGACLDSMAIITGAIRDAATGEPIARASVALSWIEILFTPNRPLVVLPSDVTVQTDSSGRYALCVPPKPEVTAYAHWDRQRVRTGRVDIPPMDRMVAVQDFTIDRSITELGRGNATLTGQVLYQDGTPLSTATVVLDDPAMSTQSDSAGLFAFRGIPGGTRTFDTRAMGHAPMRTVVDVKPSGTTDVRVYLRQVTMLDPVVVRASSGAHTAQALIELEERRVKGLGYRLTPVELLGFKHARMDAVVRALPFVRVRSTPAGLRVALPGRGGRDCVPSIWIDGRPSSTDILDVMMANEALALEIFTRSTDVPMRYRTFSDCGAILLWTREGVSG